MSFPFTNLPLPFDSTKQTLAQEAEGGQTPENWSNQSLPIPLAKSKQTHEKEMSIKNLRV